MPTAYKATGRRPPFFKMAIGIPGKVDMSVLAMVFVCSTIFCPGPLVSKMPKEMVSKIQVLLLLIFLPDTCAIYIYVLRYSFLLQPRNHHAIQTLVVLPSNSKHKLESSWLTLGPGLRLFTSNSSKMN